MRIKQKSNKYIKVITCLKRYINSPLAQAKNITHKDMHIATQTLIPKGEEEEEAKQLIETLPPTMRRNLLVETEENRRKLAAEKEKREYYLFKISKLTGTEPSLYQKLTDQSNLLDITEMYRRTENEHFT